MEKTGYKDELLLMAKEAYRTSTTFLDNNYRRKWDDSYAHFNSKHTSDSLYSKKEYQYRSKLFRPKTRAAIRQIEAAGVAAFFANEDAVSISPRNINDPAHILAAAINDELLNYHFQETIPWFITCIGGLQDAAVVGVVGSYQYWDYKEDSDGNVVRDKPCIDLIAVENFRFHPSADWRNPVQSSPYFIRMVPMLVVDVEARMHDESGKIPHKKWKRLTRDELKNAINPDYDETRQAREEMGQDRFRAGIAESVTLGDFDTIWCHEIFIKIDDADYVYWTAGTTARLSDPVLVSEEYFSKERPCVIGCAIIEAHKPLPDSIVELGKQTQKEINENVNTRLDNQKLAMNKRYFVNRRGNVDIRSLMDNIAGSATLMDNVDTDVRVVDFNDIQPSSFADEDRLNLSADEIFGSFSGSSIQSNRRMNETVGGIAMLRGSTNTMVEYILRTFAETWVEPVCRQVMQMIKAYETDINRLTYAFGRTKYAPMLQEENVNLHAILSELMDLDVSVKVNVGMGATDPIMKLQNFMLAINSYTQVLQMPPGMLNVTEIGKEIFGRLGYKDGQRFMNVNQDMDPEKQMLQVQIQQMQQAMAQMQQALESRQMENQTRLMIAQIKDQGDSDRTAAKLSTDLELKEMEIENDPTPDNVGSNIQQ